jgi:uncharacterized protein (TIRG00374 family)
VLVAIVAAAAAAGFVIFVVPQISGLGKTLARLSSGSASWLGLGVGFEAVSLVAYVALFRAVFSSGEGRIGWRASFQITFAGDVATKIFAAAGAGSVALTVWALRAAGLSARTVARRLVCLEVLLYAIYMASLVVAGVGLRTGVFPGRAPMGLTVIPAVLGAVVIALAVSTLYVAEPTERWFERRAARAGSRAARRWSRAAAFPRALGDGLRTALQVLKTRRAAPVAAFAYWALDIAALWASFRAFGHAPPVAVLVLGYFVGTLGNALPLPGGIGGVEGGMIGAFLGFGVSGGLAVVAVLAYRAISYWLPTLPGLIAYVRLRGTVAYWRSSGEEPAGADEPPLPEATAAA